MQIEGVQQGTVLKVPALPVLTTTDDGDLGVEVVELDHQLVVVVSQTCDIVRAPETEPWIVVAPVEDVGEELHAHAEQGRMSPRYFALPAIGELRFPAVNVMVAATLAKTALATDAVEIVDLPLEPKDQRRLREWLGRRYARHAFPDVLENAVLRPLRKRLADRWATSQSDGVLVRQIDSVWISTPESGAAVEILIVVRPGSLNAVEQLDSEEKVRVALNTLLKPVIRRASRLHYVIDPKVREPGAVNAFELLYRYNEISVDLPDEASGPSAG